MNRLFGLNSPLVENLTKIGDMICASFLWLVFSLPVITAGASTSAMYTTLFQCLRQNKTGLWKRFWGAFRENFRVTTLAWLIELLVLAVLTLDVLVFRSLWIRGDSMGFLYWAALFFWVIVLTWFLYVAAYAARFTGGVKEILVNGLRILRLHPLHALAVMILILAGIALCLIAPVAVLLLPAAVCWAGSFILERVFLKHASPEDPEQEQHLA